MSPVSIEILIVGAGVLGLCTAVELTRRGHDVTVLDPGGPNASSVAAGMIAPALESALDEGTLERAELLRQARALWDDFAAALSIELRPGPATWMGRDAEGVATRLETLGFDVERYGAGLRVPLDAQVEAEGAMAAMAAALDRPVIRGRAASIARRGDGWSVSGDQGTIDARIVILATGAAAPPAGLPARVASLLAQIEPIRGQIGWIADGVTDGVRRTHGAYVAPSRGGTLIGATMEPRRRDLDPDAAAGAELLETARPLLDGAPLGPVEWRVGIRGATPDGLPMAGPSGEPGLHLALAPRRNGWLLGPLVARVVADGIEGRGADTESGPDLLRPLRFSSPGR